MKVKLDNYEMDILINGLFQQRCDYDVQTNSEIEDLLFRMVQKVKHKKLVADRSSALSHRKQD